MTDWYKFMSFSCINASCLIILLLCLHSLLVTVVLAHFGHGHGYHAQDSSESSEEFDIDEWSGVSDDSSASKSRKVFRAIPIRFEMPKKKPKFQKKQKKKIKHKSRCGKLSFHHLN